MSAMGGTGLWPKIGPGEPCAHCLQPQRGYATVGDSLLCHPDHGLDCYRAVTVYGHPMPCKDCINPQPAALAARLRPPQAPFSPATVADDDTTGDEMDACDLCNYDLHRCPGCGKPLRHGVGDCGDCGRE